MAHQTVDYTAVIGDLERRRAAVNARFDAAIAAIRQVMALDADLQPALPGMSPLPRFTPAEGDPYAGMSMLAAAMKHMMLKPATPIPNIELAKAIERGGYIHKSKNFPNTLNSILWRRAKTVGDIRKTAEGWQLVEM